MSVSYTHLDVYKRQPQEQAQANETGAETNRQNAALVENDGEHSFLTGESMDPEEVQQRCV